MEGLTYSKYKAQMKRIEITPMKKSEFKQFEKLEERRKKRYQQVFGGS